MWIHAQVSVNVEGESLYGWQYPELHHEATVRLSFQDMTHANDQGYETATVLGILRKYECASLDPVTGEITVTDSVPETQENRKAKQNIVNYILAQKNEMGEWVVGGQARRPTSRMVFQISAR